MLRAAVLLEPPKMMRGAVCDDHLQAGVAAFIQKALLCVQSIYRACSDLLAAQKIGQATSFVEKSATNVP